MNILIYARDFAPKIGGEETHLLLLGRGLAQRLARSDPGQGSPGPQGSGRLTMVTPTAAGTFDDSSLPYRVVRLPAAGLGLPRLSALWKLIGEADIVQLSGPLLLPLALSLLRRKPILIRHLLYHAVCPNGLLFYQPAQAACPGHFMAGRYAECFRCNASTVGPWKSALLLLATFPRRWLCRQATGHAAMTHHVAARLQLSGTRVIYHGVPNTCPPKAWACPEPSQGAPQPGTALPFCFGYVGRLVREKGLTLLLEAAHALRSEGRDFRIKFVGDGPQRARLEAQVDALGLRDRVQFIGFLSATGGLQQAVADISALLMPSLWEETAGLSAIEQMMRGGLVIAADIGGLGELVGDAGLKFPAGNAQHLAACMRQALSEPALVEQLGLRARERAVLLFRQERMVDELYAACAELASSSRGFGTG